MDPPKAIAFEIIRVSQGEPENIQADSVETEGNPPQYVFRQGGNVVRKLFVHALEMEPQAIFPTTPEQKAAWKKFRQKASAANHPSYLKRE